MDIEVGELLVVRLWRWDPDRLHDDAEKEVRQDSPPSISVYGMVLGPEDEVEALMVRLCETVKRNAKYAAFTTGTKLERAGFPVRASEPPENHFDVHLRDHNDRTEVEALATVFDEYDRRKFPSCLIAA